MAKTYRDMVRDLLTGHKIPNYSVSVSTQKSRVSVSFEMTAHVSLETLLKIASLLGTQEVEVQTGYNIDGCVNIEADYVDMDSVKMHLLYLENR
jgi:hypothetical protein